MEPSTHLDHAVFQLTPTRTRCDLLVCSRKGVYDKIASGLLEPFLSHLRCAREQVPKGGYSFTLRPPPATAAAARATGPGGGGDQAAAGPPSPPWFTKGTLERFVRFVRTPEILERVAAIEKEIVHIESCVHPAAEELSPAAAATTTMQETAADGTGKAAQQGSASNHGSGDDSSRKLTASPKLKVEANGLDATHGENSKHCLQQVLETRKAVLLKEQGMAYARAAVAGFEMAYIDDLVSFADTFGASRLREACMNFKDLCKKREKDKIWMDELAAIGACSNSELCIGTSGILLTGEPINSWTNNSLAPLEAVTGDHPELNGTLSDAVTDPTSSDARKDTNGQTPSREPWISASNGNHHEKQQLPFGWASHPSQYMHNFQPPAPQMPPYQGYAFSGTLPPYFPGQFENAQQHPFKEVSDLVMAGDDYSCPRYYMPSGSNHGKPVKMNAARTARTTSGSRNGERSDDSSKSGSESGEQTHHDSCPEQEVLGNEWGRKRSNKKSSRTVVIRNINFISSERRDEEDGSTSGSSVEGDINEAFLKEKVENIVGSLEKYHKMSRHQHKSKGKNRNHRNIHSDDNSFDKNSEIVTDAKVCKGTKGDESWHAFQSILMKDESSSTELHGGNNIIPTDGNVKHHINSGDDSCVIKNPELNTSFDQSFPLESESLKGNRQRLDETDPIITNAKDDNYKKKSCSGIFNCEENYCTKMKRSHNADEELLFSERSKLEIVTPDDITGNANETLAPTFQRGADWFIVSKCSSLLDGQPTAEYSMFDGDQSLKSLDEVSNEKTRNELPMDDSFVLVTRSTADDHPVSQWETDMSIISGLACSSETEHVGVASHSMGNRVSDNHEPDDLQMVLERDTQNEPVCASWIPEIDYTADITFNVDKESDSVPEANSSMVVNKPPNPKVASGEGNPRNKYPGKDAKSKSIYGSLSKLKSEVMSRTKKPSAMSREEIHRNKMMKEEENRRRMEELLVQRQKRIAERSSSSTTSPAMTKVSTNGSKLGAGSSKHEKKSPQSATQGNNRQNLLHKVEVAGLTKNPHAPEQCKKNGKVVVMAM